MVDDRKAKLTCDLHNAVGRQAVGLRWQRQPGGMIMGQNSAGRVGARHGPQQLAGVNRNAVWHPLGNAQVLHRAAGIVQQDQIKLFILDAAEQRLDICNGRLCLAQRLAGDALF